MKIDKVNAVYYSACGSTAKVVKRIAGRISEILGVPMEIHDFTLPAKRREMYEFNEKEFTVFGTPVYAGRIPNKMLPIIQKSFSGNGSRAAAVVTFGNRSYDYALLELRNELEKNDFHTVAAGAFPVQHVFTEKLATGRPDENDLKLMDSFAGRIAEKITDEEKQEKISGEIRIHKSVDVRIGALTPDDYVCPDTDEPVGPYYRPLGTDGKPAVFLKAKPLTDVMKCSRCGICAVVCPMGSISSKDVTLVEGICIKCQACVKKCPEDAKYFEDPAMMSHIEMLEKNYSRRTEAEIFI